MPRFSPSGFFGPSRCLVSSPGLTSCAPCACVCVCAHTHIDQVLFAFITGISNLGPLLEGLLSQIHLDLGFVFLPESNREPADNYFSFKCSALTN